MPDGKRAVASGAAASSAARGERAEGVLAAEAGRRGDGRGTAETWRAPCWDGTLVENGGAGDGGVPAWRTGCGAWPNQQRGLKEQAGPFLQGVLLGGRPRCWTLIKLVISPINLNKI